MDDDTHRYLTTQDVADLLRTSPSSVRWWRAVGYGPPGIKVGRRVLYRSADVTAWLGRLEADPSRAVEPVPRRRSPGDRSSRY